MARMISDGKLEIEVDCRLSFDRETAEACLRIASLYARQTGSLIALERGDEGLTYRFKEAADAD